MATYTGLWEGVFGQAHALTGTKSALKRNISRVLRKNGARGLKELMLELNGAAAGQAASSTFKRVSHDTDPYGLGGTRAIDTVTVLSRNTASADETEIDTVLVGVFAPSSYPSSGDGRDAGGMVGKF